MKLHVLLIVAAAGLTTADDPKTKVPDPQKELQGTWKYIAGERDGEKVPDREIARAPKLVIEGEKYTFKAGDEGETGTIKLDPAKKPKTIDLAITSGPDKDKKQVGIYQVEGDTLKLCVAPPGDAQRPATFNTKGGDG